MISPITKNSPSLADVAGCRLLGVSDESWRRLLDEGVANLVRTALKESLKATITRQVGALLSRSAFTDFKKRLDHTEYGGAPLLGVKGVCIVTHGSSNANAMKNAVRVAAEFYESGVNQSIERGLAALHAASSVAVTHSH